MHVLFLTSTLPRWAGDMQANFVGEQADAWLEARPDDRITILAPASQGAPGEEHHGRKTIKRYTYARPASLQTLAYPAIMPNLKARPWRAWQIAPLVWAQYRRAKEIIGEGGVDLVYAHWAVPQGLVAHRLKARTGVPYILQTHSSDLSVLSNFGSAGRGVARAMLQQAEHFFCVNAGQLDLARGYYPELATGDTVTGASVIPMGVAKLQPMGSSTGEIEIGSIGRLSKKKGLDLLIRALEKLHESGVSPRVGIAGDGEEREHLQSLKRRANVDFLGFLSGKEKEHFLESCERFAFPAKASGGDVEGLPVALLEALMRGQPVLASRDTNIELLPEWDAIKRDVVFVEDPTDVDALACAIVELMARSPGSAGQAKQVLSRYLWSNLIEEYLEPIERRLKRRTGA